MLFVKNVSFPAIAAVRIIEEKHVEIQGSIKKDMEFPGVFYQKLMWNFCMSLSFGVSHNFAKFSRCENHFSKGAVSNLKIQCGFFLIFGSLDPKPQFQNASFNFYKEDLILFKIIS